MAATLPWARPCRRQRVEQCAATAAGGERRPQAAPCSRSSCGGAGGHPARRPVCPIAPAAAEASKGRHLLAGNNRRAAAEAVGDGDKRSWAGVWSQNASAAAGAAGRFLPPPPPAGQAPSRCVAFAAHASTLSAFELSPPQTPVNSRDCSDLGHVGPCYMLSNHLLLAEHAGHPAARERRLALCMPSLHLQEVAAPHLLRHASSANLKSCTGRRKKLLKSELPPPVWSAKLAWQGSWH